MHNDLAYPLTLHLPQNIGTMCYKWYFSVVIFCGAFAVGTVTWSTEDCRERLVNLEYKRQIFVDGHPSHFKTCEELSMGVMATISTLYMKHPLEFYVSLVVCVNSEKILECMGARDGLWFPAGRERC